MNHEGSSGDLLHVVILLGAAVVAVPVFRRLGLGSVLGYLVGGLVVGPFGLGLFTHPEAILHVAELGVVLFLFVVGLEMRPSHLWGLRRQIFGLGAAQVIGCSAVLTGVGILAGFDAKVAFIGATGFVMTSTAIVMQLLSERGDIAQPRGQRIVSILLFEDLLIVPLLATVALMSPAPAAEDTSRLMSIAIAAGSLIGLLAVGIYALNPLFNLLAAAKAREVMTAAVLLVVLGAALVMQVGGLSMAMGAFLAGALLSESTFRHQIEADVEPFRGILLGLFFLAVGMSLDLSVVAVDWRLVVIAVPAMMLLKALGIYVVGRLTKTNREDALDRAVLMAQGGEFAFVLFGTAESAGVIEAHTNDTLTAIVVLSMAVTPLAVIALRRFTNHDASPSLQGVDVAEGLSGSVLIIGFGRFGQVMSQLLLARGVDVTLIDNDIDMIHGAGRFGFKVYYGDGTRLDVLHACGASNVRAILVCTNERDTTNRIIDLVKQEFPRAKLLVRSYDRAHALELINRGVDFQIRETFESAMRFGEMALRELGVPEHEAREVTAEIRRRDAERFELEIATQDALAGVPLLFGNQTPHLPKPAPLVPPRREGQSLNVDATATDGADRRSALPSSPSSSPPSSPSSSPLSSQRAK